MIACPECKEFSVFVVATRTPNSGKYIRRRLGCRGCGCRFNSFELRLADLVDTDQIPFFKALAEIREKKRLADPIRRHLPPVDIRVPGNWMQRSCDFIRECCTYTH